MDYDIDQMEQLGISDYYLVLSRYILNFVNNNYPLNKEDMFAIVNDKQTKNIIKRNEVSNILKEGMNRILEAEAEENKKKLEDWNNGVYSPAITVEEQEKKIFDFIQQMLEDLWNYQNGYSNIEIEKKGNGRK